MKYIIFGAGNIGIEALELLGQNQVSFFIDNDIDKEGSIIKNKEVYSFENGVLKKNNEIILVAVSELYEKQIIDQLKKNKIYTYRTYSEVKIEYTKNKIMTRPNYIDIYQKAIKWIKDNSVKDEGIINNSKLRMSYPEVTGYFIPTLIKWGYRDLATEYAKWLCSIQNEDGSWYDTLNQNPYIFDSAQILKGLISVRDIYPQQQDIDSVILKGCNWILSCMTAEGRLVTPTEEAWGKMCTELIHTYCISPLKDAAKLYNNETFDNAAKRILNYYKKVYFCDIINFNMLSHFYAYVIEAMIDTGEIELAEQAMKKIANIQKTSGAVPAYKDVDWVCSTGLFQLAICWFRLGDYERGNKAFEYACKLQNGDGGWFGSYVSEDNSTEKNTYFPDAEISWASKYFLDALYYKNICQFELQSDSFLESISNEDGRYVAIKNEISKEKKKCIILDAGCGKGRYVKKLIKELPQNKYYATDISKKVMSFFDDYSNVEKKQGVLTSLPYEDNKFDFVFSCEALEHAVDIDSAIREMARVTNDKGKIIIVDKNKDMYGYFDIESWEQWFDKDELKKIMLRYCSEVKCVENISYDNHEGNGLFCLWVGKVKEK